MHIGGMLIAGQRMTDQHRIAALGVERAIGLIGDLEGRKIDTGVELERLVGTEPHDRRTRVVGLAHAPGRFKRGAYLGHLAYAPRLSSLEHFQEKWIPVFRPKMRQRKVLV
jgi:hypothetical protein